MPYNINKLLDIAKKVARTGASIHYQHQVGTISAEQKGAGLDVVTIVDREAEMQMCNLLRQLRPDDNILSEEGSNQRGDNNICWVLDPLDGTKNYVTGYPAHAVAVGIEIDNTPAAGVIIDTYQRWGDGKSLSSGDPEWNGYRRSESWFIR